MIKEVIIDGKAIKVHCGKGEDKKGQQKGKGQAKISVLVFAAMAEWWSEGIAENS